jgi:hypothetical protein
VRLACEPQSWNTVAVFLFFLYLFSRIGIRDDDGGGEDDDDMSEIT